VPEQGACNPGKGEGDASTNDDKLDFGHGLYTRWGLLERLKSEVVVLMGRIIAHISEVASEFGESIVRPGPTDGALRIDVVRCLASIPFFATGLRRWYIAKIRDVKRLEISGIAHGVLGG
jgi:hypothetical protein